jgi:hypothetical protein
VNRQEVEIFVRTKFSAYAGIPEDQLFGEDMALSDVITKSPQMTNSIDLMEVFARTASALRKEHGVRLRLPALTLDTPTVTVLSIFLDEFERYVKEQVKEAVS